MSVSSLLKSKMIFPPRVHTPVAPRHVVGKFLDPESGLRIRAIGDPAADPYPLGSEASRLLAVLRRHGVRAFLRAGGHQGTVRQYLRAGLFEAVEL